ncbi:MAG: helix-turn-helix domain-containing protein [Holophagaceae bacterium]
MISLEVLPGYRDWGPRLDALRAFDGPLWIHGEPGSGVTSFADLLALARGCGVLDDAERKPPEEVAAWLEVNPRGVLAAHADLEAGPHAQAAGVCLAFRLPTFEDDPASLRPCLEALAREERVPDAPESLATLPCPGHLRGLRNRVVRWKLLRQLPEPPGGRLEGLALEAEDLATNLHELERVLLHRALRRSYGNRVEAAQRLGVSRRQLYLLIARHGDPVRGELPVAAGPKRLTKRRPSEG